jgi:hypothetical protein
MSYEPNVPTPPRGDGGGNNTLYFIVGGLVVLAGVFVFLYTNDYVGGGSNDIDVNVQPPAATEPATPPAAAPAQPAPAPEGNTGGTTNTQ